MAEEKKTEKDTPMIYVIRLEGYLDPEWSEWLYDMAITHESDGTTTLCGPLADQAVLHSVLERIRDMNLTLINLHKANNSSDSERPALSENEPDSDGGANES
jgi:hypothetical protein